MEEQAPDFIRNLKKKNNNIVNNGPVSSVEEAPDFIKSLNSRKTIINEDPTTRLKNKEVSQELGIDLDTERSSNEKAVSDYVDALSDDDYDTRLEWKNQGYSLEARKALMDNKDILSVDPRGNGYIKYTTLNKDDDNALIRAIYHMNQGYEQILHPWSLNVQDWLENKIDWLDENLDKEKAFNAMIERQDPYTNLPPKMAEGRVNDIETMANMVEIPRVAGSMLLHLSKRFVQAVDNLYNIGALSLAEGTNLIDKFQGEEKTFDIGYGENRSNIVGSFIQTMAAGIDASLISENPLVFYFLGMLGATNNNVEEVITKIVSKPFELFDWLMSQQTAQDLAQIAGLNSSDVQGVVELGGLSIFEAMNAFLGRSGRTISKSESYKQGQYVLKKANQAGKDSANTNIVNSTSTEVGTLGKERIKSYTQGFKEFMNKFRNNKQEVLKEYESSKPKPEVKPTEKINEITESRQQEVDEKGFYTDQKPIESKKTTKLEGKVEPEIIPKNKSRFGESIDDFGGLIKSIANKLSGKKGGLNKELSTKFQEDIQLQNEFRETVEPYLKNGGADNPSGVIKEPLTSLVESIKDKIETRQENNKIFRKGQEKYKVQKTLEEKIQQKIEDEKLNGLLKVINKKIEDPEKFLEYLIKLSEERKAQIEELAPGFEVNLKLIQDTLALTKALVKSDLVERVISFRSMTLKNKAWIRKWLYKKISEKYRKAGINYNVNELENMINRLTNEKLADLEMRIENNEELPRYMKEDFINNLVNKNDKSIQEALYGKQIGDKTYDVVSKSDKEKAYRGELTKQGYTNIEDNTPIFNTPEEARNYKLPDGTTIGDFMDKLGIKFDSKFFKDFQIKSEADFWNKAIRYSQSGFKLSSFVVGHELAHFLLGKLTTSELFDIVEGIKGLTKSAGKEVNRVGMGEYLADTISDYLNNGNIDGVKNLLTKGVKDSELTSKVKSEVSDFTKDLEKNISKDQAFNEITKQIEDLIKKAKDDKLYQGREPKYEDPRHQGGYSAGERLEFLKKVDPNLEKYDFDLDIDSPTFSEMIFKTKDGKNLSREEWKNNLSHKQYLDLYSSEDLFNLEKEIKRNSKTSSRREDIKNEIKNDELYKYLGKDKYTEYKDILRERDPDILGLVEKDGQIYVKYKIESNRERYEMSDRPGYIEIKEVPAKDYFTEEELNQLPKDLVKLIKKNAD